MFTVCLRIALSVLMGGLLGTERGLKNRPAGFLTYILVCLGSALMMLTNQFLALENSAVDPARFGAQVVSGIGFLGAGTIIVTNKDEIRGLTTAAGLWVAAGLGLAIGAGFYTGAVVGCVFSVFSLIALKKIDIYIKRHARRMEIYLEYNADFALDLFFEFIERANYELLDLQRGRVKSLKKELGTLTFSFSFHKQVNHQEIIKKLYAMDGVEYVWEIA